MPTATSDADTYDFIVTGAGSAGCAVAARLSESGRHRVLLLEAGSKDSNPWIHIPLGYTKTFTNPTVNWMFDSEPEKELNNRIMYQPRGKVLGGTSSINGMVYMRGNHADYDDWRQRGCTGWDWDSVLPYFKKAEDQARGPSEYHGVGGPLRVSDQPQRWELADALLEASIQAGIPRNDDFNGAQQEGAGFYQTTTTNARRWSTAIAYLRPARTRPNFVVRTKAHATRLLIENGRAVGVEYHTPGGPQDRARAPRDRRLRRRLRLPATAAAVGHRPGGASAGDGHPGAARAAGGREPARPFQHLPDLQLRQADHAERAAAQPAAPGRCRGAVRAVPQGADVGQRSVCRRLLLLATSASSGPTSR